MNSLDNMKRRLEHYGGIKQIDRNIEGKRYSLESAIKSGDYDTIDFTIDDDSNIYQALANENKLMQGYDDKEISCNKELAIGSVIHTNDLGDSYWMIYRKELAERAYFRGYMRKCKNDYIEFGSEKTRAVVIGPKNTEIDWEIKSNNRIDSPNLIITIWIPATEKNKEFFKRYAKFEYANLTWEIQSVNAIDYEGILICSAKENYEIIPEIKVENEDNIVDGVYIEGTKIMKPLQTQTYKISSENFSGEWTVEDNKPITILNKNEREITIKWTSTKSGEFTLSFGDISQLIKVESLF